MCYHFRSALKKNFHASRFTVGLFLMWNPHYIKITAGIINWWQDPCFWPYITVVVPWSVKKNMYLLSNVRGLAGWHTMLLHQSQKWSLALGLLWRPGCFLWSTWEPEFDPAVHSCPWLPGLLCLETLYWWKHTREKRSILYFQKALI